MFLLSKPQIRALLAHVATKGDNRDYLHHVLFQGDGSTVVCIASNGYTCLAGETRQTAGDPFRITIAAKDLGRSVELIHGNKLERLARCMAIIHHNGAGWLVGDDHVDVHDFYPDVIKILPSLAEIEAAKDSPAVPLQAERLAEVSKSVIDWSRLPKGVSPHVVHLPEKGMAAVVAHNAIGIVMGLSINWKGDMAVPSFLRSV
jgi:hypothetical protein